MEVPGVVEESIHFQIRALLVGHPLKIRESSILHTSQWNFTEITLYDLYYYTDDPDPEGGRIKGELPQ